MPDKWQNAMQDALHRADKRHGIPIPKVKQKFKQKKPESG